MDAGIGGYYPTWRPTPMEPPRTSACTLYF